VELSQGAAYDDAGTVGLLWTQAYAHTVPMLFI